MPYERGNGKKKKKKKIKMGCIWIFWAGLVICAFVLGIDKWAFAFPGCGETGARRRDSASGRRLEGEAFSFLLVSVLVLVLGIVTLCRSLAVFLLGVFRLGLLSCLDNSPLGAKQRVIFLPYPPFPPFPLSPFSWEGESLVASLPPSVLGWMRSLFFCSRNRV